MARYVRQLAALGPPGLIDLVVLSVMGVVAELGVRFRPLPQVAGWFGLRLTGEPTPASGWTSGERHRRRRGIVAMMMRHWPFADHAGLCLREALLIGWILRERDPLLRIGVSKRDGAVTAHAWLELEGVRIGADGLHQPLGFDLERPTN